MILEQVTSNMDLSHDKVKLAEVNPHLTCYLCKAYLIDATTIVECLHSFCRSCIIKFLQVHNYCPVCEVIINTAKPNIKPDKTLQDIVYKLVPGLYTNEMERRRTFYTDYPEEASRCTPEARGSCTERLIFSPDDQISLSIEYTREDNSAWHLKSEVPLKRYLQCPAVFKIVHLKKFICNKYNVDTTNYHVDIYYKRAPLLDHYTLMDVAYIYSWQRTEPMQFYFCITDINYVSDVDMYDPLKKIVESQTNPKTPRRKTPSKTKTAKRKQKTESDKCDITPEIHSDISKPDIDSERTLSFTNIFKNQNPIPITVPKTKNKIDKTIDNINKRIELPETVQHIPKSFENIFKSTEEKEEKSFSKTLKSIHETIKNFPRSDTPPIFKSEEPKVELPKIESKTPDITFKLEPMKPDKISPNKNIENDKKVTSNSKNLLLKSHFTAQNTKNNKETRNIKSLESIFKKSLSKNVINQNVTISPKDIQKGTPTKPLKVLNGKNANLTNNVKNAPSKQEHRNLLHKSETNKPYLIIPHLTKGFPKLEAPSVQKQWPETLKLPEKDKLETPKPDDGDKVQFLKSIQLTAVNELPKLLPRPPKIEETLKVSPKLCPKIKETPKPLKRKYVRKNKPAKKQKISPIKTNLSKNDAIVQQMLTNIKEAASNVNKIVKQNQNDINEKDYQLQNLLNKCKINIPSSLSVTLTEKNEDVAETKPNTIKPVQNYIEILPIKEEKDEKKDVKDQSDEKKDDKPKEIKKTTFQTIFEEAVKMNESTKNLFALKFENKKPQPTKTTPLKQNQNNALDLSKTSPKETQKRNILEIAHELSKKSKLEAENKQKSETKKINIINNNFSSGGSICIQEKLTPPNLTKLPIPRLPIAKAPTVKIGQNTRAVPKTQKAEQCPPPMKSPKPDHGRQIWDHFNMPNLQHYNHIAFQQGLYLQQMELQRLQNQQKVLAHFENYVQSLKLQQNQCSSGSKS